MHPIRTLFTVRDVMGVPIESHVMRTTYPVDQSLFYVTAYNPNNDVTHTISHVMWDERDKHPTAVSKVTGEEMSDDCLYTIMSKITFTEVEV